MARSETAYAAISRHLGALPGVSEKPMFGGVCFMLDGNMICGAVRIGAMARVGKGREAEAAEIPGVIQAMPSGRKMSGFVTMPEAAIEEDPEGFARLLDMALTFTATLPPK